MKKILMTVVALLPGMALAGGVFPANPVPMSPGYGAEGAGNHYGVPYGRPGLDCAVNPVSIAVRQQVVVIEEYVEGDTVSIPANVLFDFNRDIVREEGLSVLTGFYAQLVELGVLELRVVGHTDSRGTYEYNQALGQRRADAVAEVLTSLGFTAEQVTTESRSFSEPVAPNANPDGTDNPEGRQLNRRVDIEIVRVAERKVAREEVVTVPRNPQVLHRLSSGQTVYCGGDEIPARSIQLNPGVIFNPGRWRW